MIPAVSIGMDRAAFQLPHAIPGLLLWLDANSTNIVANGGAFPNNGDPVTTWGDQAQHGQAFTQGVLASMPTYRTNVLNGKPVIRFDGTDDWMDFPINIKAFPQGTIFCVCTKTAGNGTEFIIADNSPSFACFYFILATTAMACGVFNTQFQRPTGIANGSFADHSTINSFGLVNGFNLPTNGTTGALNPANVTLQMGARSSGTVQPLNGDIAELLIFGRGLVSAEVKYVNNYLCAKWALASKSS